MILELLDQIKSTSIKAAGILVFLSTESFWLCLTPLFLALKIFATSSHKPLENLFNLSLSERAKIANDFKADYFLSIHINSATDSSVRGVEVWQYSNKNDKLNKFSYGLCEDVANIFMLEIEVLSKAKNFLYLKIPICLLL